MVTKKDDYIDVSFMIEGAMVGISIGVIPKGLVQPPEFIVDGSCRDVGLHEILLYPILDENTLLFKVATFQK